MTNQVKKIKNILIVLVAIIGLLGLYQINKIDFTQSKNHDGPYNYQQRGQEIVSKNPNNKFFFKFDNGSFEITSLENSQPYHLRYQLKQIEVSGSKLNISSKPKYHAVDAKLEESHHDFSINYTNNEKGLRQDFVINDGPTQEVKIKVGLELSTNLTAHKIDQFSLVMTDSINKAINIYYKDLIVYDAKGKFMHSEIFLEKTRAGTYEIALVASGTDITYPVTVDPLSTSDTGFESAIDSTYTGFAIAGNCDINNDGFCDAIIGSYGFTNNAIKNSGKVDIFLGKMSGIDLSGTPDFTILGGTAINKVGFDSLGIGGKFGFSLDCAGDLNNDNYDDIIIGAPATSMIDTTGGGSDTINEVGAFYIYYGSATGLSLVNVDTVYGMQDTMALGYKVAGLGDVNSGGFGDISVSAPGFDGKKGVVYIYEGRMTGGINRTPIKSLMGSASNEQYGTALDGPGDINGDGLNDILIGAHNYTNNSGTRRDTAAGIVHMFLGNATSINTSPDWQAVGPHKNAQFGYSVSGAGNYDGIGQKDIIVGANQYNPIYVTTMPDTILCLNSDTLNPMMYSCYGTGKGQGAVFVYSGTNIGLSNTITSTLLNESSATGFGSAVSNAGDVDGDGRDDIIVGAPFYSKDSINAQGAVYGYYGKNFANGQITNSDWCVFGERGNSFLGTDLDKFGGCGNAVDTVGVIIGAYGYNATGMLNRDTLLRGAAFIFKKSTCGLKKYDRPQFTSFDSDTLFVDSEAGKCGANVSFIRPTVGSNCPATLTVVTGIDSSGLFPIGNNTVTFRITSEGITVDSSFVIVVNDVESPVPTSCAESSILPLPTGSTSMPITWTDPVFTDNHTCSGGVITVTQISGELKNTVLPVGVYPIVYEGKDSAGNVSFCTFRVIISKTSANGRDCSFQSIVSSTTVSQPTSTDGDVTITKNLKDYFSLNRGNFGLSLLISLFEGASGISIPGWIKAALGEAGTGINLAFVEVKFNFLPEIDLQFGAYYKIKEATPLALNVNYAGSVCSIKPADKLFGCRDTIPFATSFFINQNPANTFLKVTPGQLNQTFGVFMRDFVFRWRISFEVSACIGVPLCIPIIGPCLGCLGYRASYSQGVDVFNPIMLLTGSDAIELDLISVCDKSFQQGASIFSVFNCLGIDPLGADSFLKNLLGELPIGPDANPIDPFFYDLPADQFVFEPNRIPKIGNRIPEMKFRFGRLTNGETVTDPGFPSRVLPTEMGPTTINGSKLVVSGREKNLFSAEVDIFSLLYYAIPVKIQQSLACAGIDIGTRTIDIGTPKITPASGTKPAKCEVPFYAKKLSIDVLDINLILRSEYNVNYDYNPTIAVEDMDLGQPTYWERPSTGQSGTSQFISNVGMDENIRILVPDGQVSPYFINNTFSASGQFNGNESKTQKVDIGFNVIEFLPSLWIPSGIPTLLKLGPFNLLSLGSRNIRTINRTLPVPDFNATVTMTPDDIPPVIACRDTTVFLDANGFAYLDHEAAFDRANSYDLPRDGSGKLNFIGGYPDTIFCSDYPSTFGYIIVEDDNCNFDTCRYIVTVEDNILPQMGCVDIVVGIGANGTYELNPDEIAIGVTDNCRELIVTASPSIFDCDDVGIPQRVTIFATDIAGNRNSCTVNVTVVDTMPLLLECPYLVNYPVYRNTREGLCFYTAGMTEFRPRLIAPDCNTRITYQLTGATIGTGNNNVNGINFNLGQTTITYTATDESGNSTVCSFILIVEDNQSPLITCPIDITIGTNHDLSNNNDCATNYTWQHPRPLDNCTIIGYNVTYTNPDGSINVLDLKNRYLSNTLSETRNFPLGKTMIEYFATDTMNNTVTCSFVVEVEDDELPVLFCNEVVSCQPYTYDGNVDIRPNDITSFPINITNNINITDLSVKLVGSSLNMGQLSFALRSPAGLVVPLFGALCNNTTTFNLYLNDTSSTNVALAPCNPLGNGGTFKPVGLLSGYNGQSSLGIWQLLVTNSNPASCASLTDFVINICGNSIDDLFNTKVSVLADDGKCDFTVLTKDFDPDFTDNCTGTTLSHNYILGPNSNTLQGAVFSLGSTPVVWTATDASGNTRSCTIIYEVKDRNKPVFINCPEPDVIQNAEPNICGAFVNFAIPIAFDDCGGQMTVIQIDTTGLATGSFFPVGMTILTYKAEDASGNSATCKVRVIVNDTQNGLFACPQSVIRTTDPWLCSAIVDGIAPTDVVDNCAQNATITYQIEFPMGSGNIQGGGVKNASGKIFEKGRSRVTYKMSSQPSLLITEVTQEIAAPIGGMSPVPYSVLTTDDYLELTNFGPAAYNVSGLIVERFGTGFSEVFEVPNKTILLPGKTLVVHFGNGTDDIPSHFFNVPCAVDLTSDQKAGYVISFKGRVIDAVATNGYNPIGNANSVNLTLLEWSGNLPGTLQKGGVIRKYSFDNNSNKDWVVSENCYPLTIGILNPDLEVYTSNGSVTALQSIAPHIQICNFTVDVNDVEAPFCAEISRSETFVGGPVAGGFDSCNEGTISVPNTNDSIVREVNVTVNGSFFGADSIFMVLTSPSGKSVTLVNNTCVNTADGNVTLSAIFDDDANNLIASACGSATWNGPFVPQQPLLGFYGTLASGIWTLNVGGNGLSSSRVVIDSWSLSLTKLTPFQMDNVEIDNELGKCNSQYSWTHPYILDNCREGSISVAYTTSDADCVPVGSTLPVFGGQSVTQTFCVGTTTVTYTLTDQAGNINTCSFDVKVLDAEKPIINQFNCRNYDIHLNPSECDRVLVFNTNPLTIGTDNCGIDSIIYSPASGTAFPIGITVVTLTIKDEAGNIATCNFNVEIKEYLPQNISFACNGLVNISLDENCKSVLTVDMILTGTEYRCLENYCISTTTLEGEPHANSFDLQDIGKTFKVSITDCLGSKNSCWGLVKIEEKLLPTIKCPDDVTVYCGTNTSPDNTGYAFLKSCEPFAKIYYEDNIKTFGLCDNPRSIITRTWYLDDNQGNIVNCEQEIVIIPITLNRITWPKDIEVDQALECADVVKLPALVEPNSTGYPTINGMELTLGNRCMISITKNDEIFPLCGGSYVIARTWKALNACKPLGAENPKVHVQAIKVFDTEQPVIDKCPNDFTVSTSAWVCAADTINLPIPQVLKDECSNTTLKVKVFGGGRSLVTGSINSRNFSIKAINVSKGPHVIEYSLYDDCGNVAKCSFTVTVKDQTAPIAIAKEMITISLTKSGDFSNNGIGKVTPSMINNGSYDNCSKSVYLEVRRDGEVPSCLNEGGLWDHDNNNATPMIPWNNNRTFNSTLNGLDQTIGLHLNDSELDTDKGQFVKFCCEDVGKAHKVILRVWDDADMNGIFGTEGDNFNETWANVLVEDKTLPQIKCPVDISIDCTRDTGVVPVYNFVSSLTAGTWLTATATNTPISFLPTTEGACGAYEFEFKDVGTLSTCNTGTFTRTYRVKANGNPALNSVTCTSRVVVGNGPNSNPSIEWPIAMHIWNNCELTEADVINNTVRARLNVRRESIFADIFNNATCITDNQYNSAVWATGNPAPASSLIQGSVVAFLGNLCTAGGPGSALNESVTAAYNVNSTTNDACGVGPANPFLGGRPGPLSTIPGDPKGLGGNPRFNSNVKDPGCNVFGKKLTIEEFTVGDACKKWLVRWDYINWCCNGKIAARETIYKYEDTTAPVITSAPGLDTDIIDASCAINHTFLPSATDNFCNGQTLTWSAIVYANTRVIPLNPTGITTLTPHSSSVLTGNNPSIVFRGLPVGEHGIRYFVTDGCGNRSERDSVIGIWPKAATPYCVSLSSAVMKNGLVELWAKDFDRGSFTNCGSEGMLFTFNRGGSFEHPAGVGTDSITYRHYFTGAGKFLSYDNSEKDGRRSSDANYSSAIDAYNKGTAQLWMPDVTVRPRPILPNGTVQSDERILTGGTSGMQFGCKVDPAQVGAPFTVEMRVWDMRSFKAGTNQGSDFCSTRLTLIDNEGACGKGSIVSIGGKVSTFVEQSLKDVEVGLKANLPEYPAIQKTDANGKFDFPGLPIGLNYEIFAKYDLDYTNGVNTLDLVKIQRHILGLQKLDNPFYVLAADADSDQAIRVSDIVEIRKLILGITDKYTNSPSWKFVEAAQQITDNNAPWPFNEVIAHANLTEVKSNNNFFGVKTGDVDGNAKMLGFLTKLILPRKQGISLYIQEQEVKSGEIIELEVKVNQFKDIYGYQLAMNSKGMKILGIEGRGVDIDGSNVNLLQSGVLSMSWSEEKAKSLDSDAVLFIVKLQAEKSGKLSDMIDLKTDGLQAEAYVGSDLDVNAIDLEVRSAQEFAFDVAQNQPNPWKTGTIVKYQLPYEGTVKLTITDISGKVITSKTLQGKTGTNQVSIDRAELRGASGIMLYKLMSHDKIIQRKMIVVE